jgi:UDP-N-acetylglucosamine 2-epimerase (non-hydrolysing)
MSPVIRELAKRNADFFVLHTGQHYSYNLDGVFFEQLNLPKPEYNVGAGSGSHAEQTARILLGAEKVLLEAKPDIVLVQGDTNSVLAVALVAAKLHIKVGHIEAGLRSYDRSMPEEINRVLADHCSDFLFAPTEKQKTILLGEGIPHEKIFVTGNTIVDAVYENQGIAEKQSKILEKLEIMPGRYFLATLHRQENVDDKLKFGNLLEALEKTAAIFHLPVIYPVHPHSRKKIEEFGLNISGLKLVDPLDFLDFLWLESNARLVLTDSGGVQEETCIIGVPCVTMRDNTERPETIEVGANCLAGTTVSGIQRCARFMINRDEKWENPFGDGTAAEKILNIILGGSDV